MAPTTCSSIRARVNTRGARAASHAQNQARGIGVGEHDLHDHVAARLDERERCRSRRPRWASAGSSKGCHCRTTSMTRLAMRSSKAERTAPLSWKCSYQRAPADARPGADVGDRGVVEPRFRERLERAVEDVVAAIRGTQVGPADGNRHVGSPVLSYWSRGQQKTELPGRAAGYGEEPRALERQSRLSPRDGRAKKRRMSGTGVQRPMTAGRGYPALRQRSR